MVIRIVRCFTPSNQIPVNQINGLPAAIDALRRHRAPLLSKMSVAAKRNIHLSRRGSLRISLGTSDTPAVESAQLVNPV